MTHNIVAVHARDANAYKLKTLRLRQDGRMIDVTVYDMCSDSDCSGCCTRNASETGFLIDIEKYTMQRFGRGDGIVEWVCLDCQLAPFRLLRRLRLLGAVAHELDLQRGAAGVHQRRRRGRVGAPALIAFRLSCSKSALSHFCTTCGSAGLPSAPTRTAMWVTSSSSALQVAAHFQPACTLHLNSARNRAAASLRALARFISKSQSGSAGPRT